MHVKLFKLLKKNLTKLVNAHNLPKLCFTEYCPCVSTAVCPPVKESFPVRGDNTASSVEGTEENPSPSSAYESSMFISFAIRMATA